MSELAIPLRWTLGGIYSVLVAATAVAGSWRRLRPSVTLDEVVTRIRTWWMMSIAFTIAVVLGPLMTVALFSLIGLVATREFLRLSRTRDRVAAGLAFATIPVAYGSLAIGLHLIAWLAPLVMAIFVTPAVLALSGKVERYQANAAAAGVAGLLTVWAPMHAVLLLVVPDAYAPAGPAALLVFLVLCTEVNDVAQFLSGKAFGRTAISPRVSPNKTREGLLGGIATTALLAGVMGPALTGMSAQQSVVVGAGLALLGFSGDVTVSALKRSAGAKDSGSALPGHGGVLDRIDSLIFTAPAYLAIVMFT